MNLKSSKKGKHSKLAKLKTSFEMHRALISQKCQNIQGPRILGSPHGIFPHVLATHWLHASWYSFICLCHASWVPRRLDYDTWTTMLPNKSTHPQAETDLPLGRARIPANWSLQLVPILATRVRVQHATSLRNLLTPFPVYSDPAEPSEFSSGGCRRRHLAGELIQPPAKGCLASRLRRTSNMRPL